MFPEGTNPYDVIRRTTLRSLGERAPESGFDTFMRGWYLGILDERRRKMQGTIQLDNVKNITVDTDYSLVNLRFGESGLNVDVTLTQAALTDLLHKISHVIDQLDSDQP